jgi:hypothetical protein
MIFSKFLIEQSEPDFSNLHKETINQIVNGNNETFTIFRGMSAKAEWLVKSSLTKTRTSANTTNEYNMLFSEVLPSWHKFPKRNKSFICATSKDVAGGYGIKYYVFPFGNPNIGICPEIDIWASFTDKLYNLDLPFINESLKLLYELIIDSNSAGSIAKTKEQLMSNLSEIEKYILSLSKSKLISFKSNVFLSRGSDAFKKLTMQIVTDTIKNNSIIKSLDELLKPTDFILKPYLELIKESKSKYKENEIWFSGKALFINYQHFEDFRDKYKDTLRKMI